VTEKKSYSKYFLLGTMLGFLLSTAAGAYITGKPLPLSNFVRFHEYINPNGGFYLTYNQMLAQARLLLADKPGKPLLIIGGDSVFYGEGQSSEHCWTKYLQQELGDDYAVINLALPGTKVFEAGYWVYEKLLSEGQNVFLLTDAMPSTVFEPSGTTPLHYMYFDARERGMLLPYAARETFSRQHREWTLFKDEGHQENLELRAKLNHYLGVEELWTQFTYSVAGNYFHRTTEFRSLLPRRLFQDPFEDRPPFEASDNEKLEHGTNIVKRFMAGITALYEKGPPSEYEQFFWRRLSGCTQASVPPNARNNLIVCVTAINPLFIDELNEREKKEYRHIKELWLENFTRQGFQTWSLNDKLAPEHYVDFDHLSVEGGKAMATELAKRLKEFRERKN